MIYFHYKQLGCWFFIETRGYYTIVRPEIMPPMASVQIIANKKPPELISEGLFVTF
jgi:hypothetical protein